MAGGIKLPVNPDVLKWVRQEAGLEIDEAASLLKRQPAELRAWEAGKAALTLSAGRDLARVYRRPLAVLLLHRPKPAPALPFDFRSTDGTSRRLTRDTRLAMRRARRLQSVSAELGSALDKPTKLLVGSHHRTDDASQVAAIERKRLAVTLEQQTSWHSPHQALGAWRRAVESLGPLVLQMPMPLDEVRGFSLSEGGPPAIVLNIRDLAQGRIFTLFHEYAHVLLGSGGICAPESQLGRARSDVEDERFCNSFAGNLLIPSATLTSDEDAIHLGKLSEIPSDAMLARLVNRYRVSKQVIWYRLWELEIISNAWYRAKWPQWAAQVKQLKKRPPKEMRRSAARKSVTENGPSFVTDVLEAYDRKFIGLSDALDWLEVHPKDLPKLQEALTAGTRSEEVEE